MTVGVEIKLSSADSADGRDNTLFLREWVLLSAPSGSTATLRPVLSSGFASTATAETALLRPDAAGTYVVQLRVHTATASSEPKTISLDVMNNNRAPVAVISGQTATHVGQSISLSSAGSTDLDGDTLSHTWSLLNRPTTSQVALNSAGPEATLTPDVTGNYEISVQISDGKSTTTSRHSLVVSSTPVLSLMSSSFENGALMPMRYVSLEKGGSNVSPAFQIRQVPSNTRFLALLMDDESPPCGTGARACVHWGVFNLPPNKLDIGEGEDLSVSSGALIGRNIDGRQVYLGPRPPNDGHIYRFTVYALGPSAPLVPASPVPFFRRSQFESAYASHILSQSTWVGRYPN